MSARDEHMIESISIRICLDQPGEDITHPIAVHTVAAHTPAYLASVFLRHHAAAPGLLPARAVNIPGKAFADVLGSGLVTDFKVKDFHPAKIAFDKIPFGDVSPDIDIPALGD